MARADQGDRFGSGSLFELEVVDHDYTPNIGTRALRCVCNRRRDRNYGARTPDTQLLDPLEGRYDGAARAEVPICYLQWQARVHIVDVRNAKDGTREPGEQRSFFMRIQ